MKNGLEILFKVYMNFSYKTCYPTKTQYVDMITTIINISGIFFFPPIGSKSPSIFFFIRYLKVIFLSLSFQCEHWRSWLEVCFCFSLNFAQGDKHRFILLHRVIYFSSAPFTEGSVFLPLHMLLCCFTSESSSIIPLDYVFRVCVYVCMYVCMYVCVCMCVCVCVCMCYYL